VIFSVPFLAIGMFNDFYQRVFVGDAEMFPNWSDCWNRTVQAMSSDFEKAWLGPTKCDWTMF
jgi:hypothetical protein